MTPLAEIPLPDLQWLLRREESNGIHTYNPAVCGHGSSRDGGYCAECLRGEIERRRGGE